MFYNSIRLKYIFGTIFYKIKSRFWLFYTHTVPKSQYSVKKTRFKTKLSRSQPVLKNPNSTNSFDINRFALQSSTKVNPGFWQLFTHLVLKSENIVKIKNFFLVLIYNIKVNSFNFSFKFLSFSIIIKKFKKIIFYNPLWIVFRSRQKNFVSFMNNEERICS